MKYTHNVLIKNPFETLKNTKLKIIDGKVNNYLKVNASYVKKYPYKHLISPGFLNLHTHLVYNQVNLASQNLFPWLADLMSFMLSGTFNINESCKEACQELLSYGTTFILENTSHPEASSAAILESGLRAVVGIEVFGSDPNLAKKTLEQALEKISTLESGMYAKFQAESRVKFTLSPHSSYNVSKKLFQDIKSKVDLPLILTHLSESYAEEQWFQNKDDDSLIEMKSFWGKLGLLDTKLKYYSKHSSSIDYLKDVIDERFLLTHMGAATESDLKVLEALRPALVTCPRSNRYLNNPVPDVKLWQNFNWGFGTDSKASNYSLDLRAEANCFNDLAALEKFKHLTLEAAKAAQMDLALGSLDLTKAADYVIWRVADEVDLDQVDPYEILLNSELSQVAETWVAGKQVYKKS